MTRPATPPAAPRAPAGLDTDAMRRSWPDVLAKIFTIRRVTWTFLSTHAQVLDFDGERLLLGIATRGLATTFRQGHHHEVVRQALIEALGVDARVEGVPADDAPPAGTAGRGTSPGGGTGPGRDPQEAGPARPSGNAGSGGPAAAPERSDPPSDADAPPEDDEPPEPDRDEPSGATRAGPVAASTGPPAARGPAPPQPAEPAEPAERADAAGVGSGDRAPHAPAPASSSSSVSESRAAPTPATRGREAFRQARAARRSDGGVPGRGARGPGRAADDAAASVDDEDIEDLGTVGPPVIAAVLGGTVIDERHE